SLAAGTVEFRRKKAPRGGGFRGAQPSVDGIAGRTRAADATFWARSRGTQVHPACHAGETARRLEPRCRRLSLGARLFPDPQLHGLALRAVLLARLDGGRPLCGRGFLRAERVGSGRAANTPSSPRRRGPIASAGRELAKQSDGHL